MPTQKLYLASDDLACTATITAVTDLGNRQIIRCDHTVLHVRGGGQLEDRGRLSGRDIVDVRHAGDGEVDHFVLGGRFEVGQSVRLEVDAAWRNENSRWHSAGHLIADCVSALDPSLRAARGHHWPREGRVEFFGDAAGLGALAERLSETLDRLIQKDVPFRIVGDPYRSRALQIGPNAPVPCGGTHVKSSSALVGLAIRKVQQKGGLLRVSYSLADPAQN